MRDIFDIIIFIQAIASVACLMIGAIIGNMDIVCIGAGCLMVSGGIAFIKYAADHC